MVTLVPRWIYGHISCKEDPWPFFTRWIRGHPCLVGSVATSVHKWIHGWSVTLCSWKMKAKWLKSEFGHSRSKAESLPTWFRGRLETPGRLRMKKLVRMSSILPHMKKFPTQKLFVSSKRTTLLLESSGSDLRCGPQRPDKIRLVFRLMDPTRS
jgi:hypothetical protein